MNLKDISVENTINDGFFFSQNMNFCLFLENSIFLSMINAHFSEINQKKIKYLNDS
jgi:hypothetical protein